MVEEISEKDDQKLLGLNIREMILAVIIVVLLLMVVAEEAWDDDDDDDDYKEFDVIYEPEIDPANFVDTIDHPYFPMTVGMKWTYEADTEDGKEVIVVVVTNQTKVIMGINCTVVRDTVTIDGVLLEDTYDWFVQDKDGNVWYMGEDSKEYDEDGTIDEAGSWEAGIDGAKPGVIMMAKPLAGFRYRQEFYEGEATDMGEVLSLDRSITVHHGTYEHCILIRDIDPLEPDVEEHKYYAEGIGVVAEIEIGGDERVELISIETV